MLINEENGDVERSEASHQSARSGSVEGLQWENTGERFCLVFFCGVVIEVGDSIDRIFKAPAVQMQGFSLSALMN